MTVAFIFPGQGSQHAGFLHELPEHPQVARTLAEASKFLGVDLSDIDSATSLKSTASVQISLLIAGVATARALVVEGVAPAVVAGMSIGTFGAAVASGALLFTDALSLVRLRGMLMQTAFPSGYGLASIDGLNELQMDRIVSRVSTTDCPVYVSNINAPRQIVVAGGNSALDSVATQARAEGAHRITRLAVSVPSHCPLLQSVSDELEQAMAGLGLSPPSIPLVSNRGARVLYTAEDVRDDLITNIVHPVRWYCSLEALRELGSTVFIEMPPGHVSTNLAQEFIPEVTSVAVADNGIRYAQVTASREIRQ